MTHLCEYFFKKKTSLFQGITSFRSICQIYAFWVPISAVEGPHWVPILLKIRSPLGPHDIFFRSSFNVGAVGYIHQTHFRQVPEDPEGPQQLCLLLQLQPPVQSRGIWFF